MRQSVRCAGALLSGFIQYLHKKNAALNQSTFPLHISRFRKALYDLNINDFHVVLFENHYTMTGTNDTKRAKRKAALMNGTIFENKGRKTAEIIFSLLLIAAVTCLIISTVNTNSYNSERHYETFSGPNLFNSNSSQGNTVSVAAVPRSSTWGKIYDPDNIGLTENNIQAYTYDFTVSNNTKDDVSDFTFKLTFNKDVYLSSAWNGALEIHQNTGEKEIVSTVPDLREFVPDDHNLETVTVDGETCVAMKAGDFFVYYPSSSMNAMEIPIKAYEGTTPGFILYVAVDENINDSVLELDYSFHREFLKDPLFMGALIGLEVWLITVIIYAIASARIKRYQERHERDNEIIRESIETFTGFIDAKDPYTNGHSKRVGEYTRLIAKEFGYKGEELNHIYYIALLHDCGKIGIPDAILNKPGKLTDEEFEIIKSHTVRGGEILKSFKSLKDAEMGALYHHERYDGKGYPEGKAGEDIPFVARMICVADSFDAMNSNRVYRKLLTKERIISEIENNKGLQFDPQAADVMLRLLRDGTIVMEG